MIKLFSLPGHSLSLHERLSRVGPTQSLPPNLGGGELHFLSLNCTPPPQEALHFEYADHPPKPPLIGQGSVEHSRVSLLTPTQSAPPFAGAGLSHFLERL